MSDAATPPMPPGAANELKWPKIIGILTIVFSGFNFFGAVMSFFTGRLLKFQMQMNKDLYNLQTTDIDQFLAKWNWHFVTSGLIGLITGLVLLFAGIFLLKEKKICRPLYLAYATVAILYAFYSIYVAVGSGMIDEQMNVMFGIGEGENISDYPEAKVGRISGIIGGVVGGVFAMVLPGFLLIWFMRSKIRADVLSRFA
ncbi:MAG: hypothetical protein P1V20_09920 [Verrucomicrobiales bacterium]|nr:hypothetical protein [Verrucomicrobiales bacterium]